MSDEIEPQEKPDNRQRDPTLVEKIGRTTYQVYVFFNGESKETLKDKLIRLIKRDMNPRT